MRDVETSFLAEAQDLVTIAKTLSNFSIQIHVSGTGGRLKSESIIHSLLTSREEVKGSLWVYSSGPTTLLRDTDLACAMFSNKIGKEDCPHVTNLSWHVADYSQ